MQNKYPEYKKLELPNIANEVLDYWQKNQVFEKSLENRKGNEPFVFYEGPPSANGKPGIHHVMARALKDIFCRYKTLKGHYVERKAGWDTHGLPVEIGVEKKLGITKEDIGKTISVEEYNKECRSEVMKYKDLWDDLTVKMGYWVDLENPYITFDNKYIESVWSLLGKLFDKGLLYKGYSIQPYSPAAGTGLSTHELNQPGAYKMVKDSTVTAQFKVERNADSEFLFEGVEEDLYFLAWTTTPWTLPSNTALAVGKKIEYVKVKCSNPYTLNEQTVILAKELFDKYFPEKNPKKSGDSTITHHASFEIIGSYKGKELEGVKYEQLLPYAQPEDGDAFMVVLGDFVTTEDGTGIVHIAPSFGSDDFMVAKKNNLGSLTMVDKTGRFIDQMGEFAGRFVKNEYDKDHDGKTDSVDIDIIVKLKKENKAFKTEKYEHSYPHCWRTDKPVLYYPLDSWFIKTTAYKDQMLALNETINWKPKSTGTGRFANWLENLVDWNLSRSRFWGIPIPIWSTEDKSEQICIGSVSQLKDEIEKSMEAGFMTKSPLETFTKDDFSKKNYQSFDIHRPDVDEITLVSSKGTKMFREPDLIDVWFDSGAMPYAQLHYPFENKEKFEKNYPADFIAEGVDQTRGWFFTLHAIASMLFDSVAYKTVVSNGLVLDKNGNKMSKRLGNAVDPFSTIDTYGPDALRWYMITNAQPWDNLKFDLGGIAETQRKFFGTLYNTYAFFSLYANIDNFSYQEDDIPFEERPELDRWVLSELNSLIKKVDAHYLDYEPTKAGRLIQEFLDERVSNWYVRLSRRRFWKGEQGADKLSAYQTLYKCLTTIAKLASPIAPFFMDRLFIDLNKTSSKEDFESVHLADFPTADEQMIDKQLEERMHIAQRISSMTLSLRKKSNIRVRQPLNKIMIPAPTAQFKDHVENIRSLILSETNIKGIEYINPSDNILVKKAKPNFKKLGPRFGKDMKQIAGLINAFGQNEISKIESDGKIMIKLGDKDVDILLEDVEVLTQDIPGWIVASQGNITVALDITITDDLMEEGLARDFINRIQNLRKDKGFDVTDKITIELEKTDKTAIAFEKNNSYICDETLADKIIFKTFANQEIFETISLGEDVEIKANIKRIT